MKFWLYRLITYLLGPLLPLYLRYRLRHGKEDKLRLGERLGHAGFPRPAGPLIWIHAASVGESTSVLPLIQALAERYPTLNILITTVTTSSATLMAKKLPERAFHQFVPIDHPSAIRRFLKHWQPKAAIWVESEIWPNMIYETHRSGCQMTMVNARMSARSFEQWKKHRNLLVPLLDCFDAFYPQSMVDAERLESLGAQGIEYLGNLKYDGAPLPIDSKATGELLGMIGDRPLWLAASTHHGEESACAQVHRVLKELYPELLTIIVPRHAHRGKSIASLIRNEHSLTVSRREKKEPIRPETDIYIADTMGELGIFYRLAGIVFIGGSLVPHGGQNPLEAARLDCALLYGPHMENFSSICRDLEVAGAAKRVASVTSLEEHVDTLLRNQEQQGQMAQAALSLLEKQGGVVEKLIEKLAPALNKLAEKQA